MADMFEKLLTNLVDHVLDKSGLTKEAITDGVKTFLGSAEKITKQLARIEENQIILIGAENERRRTEGKSLLSYTQPNDA